MAKTSRVIWTLSAFLGGAGLVEGGRFLARRRPYWLAKYRGREADLRGAALASANLAGVDLYHALLWGANLRKANLQGANLSRADLFGANLAGANLEEASLVWANLVGARLLGANLQRASLMLTRLEHANLRGADLRGATLHRAYLFGADLSGADLRGADLGPRILPAEFPLIDQQRGKLPGALYDTRTRWPEGFDPVKRGAVKVK